MIPKQELEFTFVRASGPGGQNVNKVSTAVELRFDVRRSPSLTDAVRARLQVLAGRKMTDDGVLVLTAQRFRTQEANREDAVARLEEMVAQASVAPKRRRATRPSKAAKARRLAGKAERSEVKKFRGAKADRE